MSAASQWQLARSDPSPVPVPLIKQYDVHIRTMARDYSAAQQLMQLMGVVEVTATAILAMVGNAQEFSCGRQFSAWIGLVPGQYSSGGKARLGRITSE